MRTYILAIFRILVGILFVTSGILKLMDLGAFALAVQKFNVVPDSFARILATILSSIEFISGLMLLIGFRTRLAISIVAALLIIFIAAIIPIILSGEAVNCGCFGPSDYDKVGVWLLIRDVILLTLTLFIYSEESYKYSIDNFRRTRAKDLWTETREKQIGSI